MPKKGANISLSSYDDIFSTQESRQETGEHVIMLPLDAIHPFKNHPFRIVDDEEMQKTAESIREYGVLVPAIVRPLENGEYEMISGHRRRYASMLAGKETMPVIVREMDDDTEQCRSSYGRWMMIPRRSSWSIPTCRESISSLVRGQRLIK